MRRFATSPEDFAERHLRVVKRSVNKHGQAELICECPQCGRPKLYLNTVSGSFVCFRCSDLSGSLVSLAMTTLGWDYGTAREAVYGAGGPLPSPVADALRSVSGRPSDAAPEAEKLVLPDEFIPIWDPEARAWNVPEYLVSERKIRLRVARDYGLGYCQSGRYEARLVFPIYRRGQLLSIQARSMVGREPKYLNPGAALQSEWLYGYDEAAGSRAILVCEGPFDVLGAVQTGFSAVALMGKSMSKTQRALLVEAGAEEIVVCLDGEARGDAARVWEGLYGRVPKVTMMRLPSGVDPGDAPKAPEKAAMLREAYEARSYPTLVERLGGQKRRRNRL